MSLAYALSNESYEYRSFTHILNTEDRLSFVAYGIELVRHSHSGSETVDSIKGITTRHEKMEKLLDVLNRFQVSPLHFHDIVEDFLA